MAEHGERTIHAKVTFTTVWTITETPIAVVDEMRFSSPSATAYLWQAITGQRPFIRRIKWVYVLRLGSVFA
jgi:hypothetical protein